MQHRPGMFADWNEMFATVAIWAALLVIGLGLFSVVSALAWSLT